MKDKEPAAPDRYPILGLFCVIAMIAYIQRAAMSVPAKEIAENLNFDLATQMGWVQSAWYFGYAAMQLPGGWLADRLGSRRAVVLFSIAWSILTGMAGFAADYWSLLFIWGAMGAAQAGVFPCATKAIGQIFKDTERARASGLLASGMTLGGALAPLITAYLLNQLVGFSEASGIWRWRFILAAYAVPGVLWGVFFWFMVPAQRFAQTAPRKEFDSSEKIWIMLSSFPLLLLCGQQFFRASAMVFFATWFPTFLQKSRDVTMLDSGWMTAIAGTCGFLGSLSGGFISDFVLHATGNRRLARQGIAVLGMGACAILIVVSYFISNTMLSVFVIGLGTFCGTFGGVSGYTVAIEFGGKHVATVFSTMNMCGNIGATLFPITVGWLVATTENWDAALFLFAGIMAIDAVCWGLLNPKGTLFGDEDESR